MLLHPGQDPSKEEPGLEPCNEFDVDLSPPRGTLRDDRGNYYALTEWHPHVVGHGPVTVTIEAVICRKATPVGG